MPISAHPGATFPYSLAIDKDLPAESRPTFICRFRSGKDWYAAYSRLEEAAQLPLSAESNDKCAAIIREVLKAGIVRWEHLDDLASLDDLPGPLTARELWELAWGHLLAQGPSEDELKKSLSQRASDAAPSARPVAAASVASGQP